MRKIKEQVVPVLAAAVESAPSAERRRTYLRALAALGPAARPRPAGAPDQTSGGQRRR
ncbi:MAG: hypothetical protein U0797_20345 [Gemmataceae bacterium]